jgi:hypothetical protein
MCRSGTSDEYVVIAMFCPSSHRVFRAGRSLCMVRAPERRTRTKQMDHVAANSEQLQPGSVSEQVATIRAEYGVSETRAYAMMVRARTGLPMTPLVPKQRTEAQQPTSVLAS